MCLPIQKFCSTLLSHIGSSDPSVSWTAKTQALALTSLKILARERVGIDELLSEEGLLVIAKLAELSGSNSHDIGNYESKEKIEGKCKHVHYINVCAHACTSNSCKTLIGVHCISCTPIKVLQLFCWPMTPSHHQPTL